MQYCTRCLYPANHPLGITFNENNECSGCIIHKEKDELDWESRFLELLKISQEYKSKDRTIHDCVVPVTGARDSHFILHTIVHELGMNPLIVNYNIHYNTAVGIRNLAYLRSLIGADFMQMTVDPNIVKKITENTIDLLGSIYWHVHAGQTVFPVQVATKYKIPLIIWGAHQGVDQVGMFSHLDQVEMTRKYRKDHDLMGIEPEDLLEMDNNLQESDLHQYFYPHDAELASVGVRGIYLNNFIRWDSRKQHEKMIDIYDYHTDMQQRTFDYYNDVDSHHYSGLHDYIKLLKHGYGKVTDHVSREIRLKSMTREKGIDLVNKYQYIEPQDVEIFTDWLGVDTERFWRNIKKHRNPKLWELSNEGNYKLKFQIT